jgi:5-methyltetrahydropteroyltriglutamate--homocysteine methyltransferase
MMTAAFPTFRADHIGSLLRPPELLNARTEFDAGRIDRAALRAIEDRAIRDIVRLQEETGLAVLTDGEYRRSSYSDFLTGADFSGVRIVHTEDEGWSPSATHGHRTARRIPAVEGRIESHGTENATDFAFTRSLTDRTVKITLPGPAFVHYRAGRANISPEVYPDLDAFWSDIVAAYRHELQTLADAGCTYVQLDETSLVKLGDVRARELLAARGDDWRDLLRVYIDVINRVVSGAPAGIRIAMHVCRSQDQSWQADTSYEPIAEALFNRCEVGAYLLEWNGPRAGSFEPLRFLPPGKRVVLGLITSQTPEIENPDEIKRRIDEASRFAPLEALALSPQCGFSTGARAFDATSYERQRRKLALVAGIARDVWGTT